MSETQNSPASVRFPLDHLDETIDKPNGNGVLIGLSETPPFLPHSDELMEWDPRTNEKHKVCEYDFCLYFCREEECTEPLLIPMIFSAALLNLHNPYSTRSNRLFIAVVSSNKIPKDKSRRWEYFRIGNDNALRKWWNMWARDQSIYLNKPCTYVSEKHVLVGQRSHNNCMAKKKKRLDPSWEKFQTIMRERMYYVPKKTTLALLPVVAALVNQFEVDGSVILDMNTEEENDKIYTYRRATVFRLLRFLKDKQFSIERYLPGNVEVDDNHLVRFKPHAALLSAGDALVIYTQLLCSLGKFNSSTSPCIMDWEDVLSWENVNITIEGTVELRKWHGEVTDSIIPYVPLEVIERRPIGTKRCHQWTLAVFLFELLTGRHPWKDPRPFDRWYQYFVIARGLSRNPNQQLMEVFKRDIEVIEALKPGDNDRMSEGIRHFEQISQHWPEDLWQTFENVFGTSCGGDH